MDVVLFHGVGIDEDIVNVGGVEDVVVFSEYVVNEVLERRWCIGESNRYIQVFKVAKTRVEGRFPFLYFLHLYQLVGSAGVPLREPFGLEESHQRFLDQGEGVAIFHRPLVD